MLHEDLLGIAASLPLDPLKSRVLIVAQAVQARSERHATTCWCTDRVLVVGVESSMEVLDHVSLAHKHTLT